MIRLILLLVVTTLLSECAVSQKTYTIKDAELQFICFDGGMIVKKMDGYYRLSMQDYNDSVVDYIKLEPAEFEKQKAYTNTIFKKDISKSISLSSLKNIKFSYTNDGDEAYGFLLNDFLFAGFSRDKDDTVSTFNSLSPFAYIEISGLKFICIFEDGVFILPTKSGIKVLVTKNYNDKTIIKIARHDATADEMSKCSNDLKSNGDDYYRIDTTGRNKYQLKNKSGKVVIAKQYDHIILDKIIICKLGKYVDLYNYQHVKLNQQPLKAFHIYYNCVQLIQGNQLVTKTYNASVTTLRKYEGFQFPYEPNGTTLYQFNIKKAGNHFYVYVDADLGRTSDTVRLDNIGKIRAVFFHNNTAGNYSTYLNLYPECMVYYQQPGGKFGFNFLGKLISKTYDDYSVFKDYQNLQSVKGIGSKLFKLEKNNLLMYYPLQKKFRYKSLQDFDGYFARYELSNGQKGWLGLNGKEYKDQ